MILNLILYIILGAAAGWIASALMGTRKAQGLGTDIVVGIVGALVGGFVFNLIGAAGVTGFNFYSLFVAVVGAVILLAIVRAVRR